MKLPYGVLRYEHRKWAKLHKIHLSVGGLAIVVAACMVIFHLSADRPTSVASKVFKYKQTSSIIHQPTRTAAPATNNTLKSTTATSSRQTLALPQP